MSKLEEFCRENEAVYGENLYQKINICIDNFSRYKESQESRVFDSELHPLMIECITDLWRGVNKTLELKDCYNDIAMNTLMESLEVIKGQIINVNEFHKFQTEISKTVDSFTKDDKDGAKNSFVYLLSKIIEKGGKTQWDDVFVTIKLASLEYKEILDSFPEFQKNEINRDNEIYLSIIQKLKYYRNAGKTYKFPKAILRKIKSL